MTARRRPAQPSDPAASPSDDTQAVPRSARNGQQSSTVPFTGFALVPVEDGKPPKMIPADATIGLKVELLGWPKIEGVGAYTCKSKTPIDVLKNTDHTPDGLHRMYGACSVQVQAWTLSATGNLEKPIQAKVWHFEPCVFDEPEDTDPEYEDEDVGTEKWAIGESWLAADQTLKKELARRTKVRRELDRGGEEYDEEEEEGDGRPPRGRGRGPSRGGPRRDWGTQARGGGGGRPRGGMDDVPDGMFDPDWTPPEPPPDMKWAWDGRTNQWRQYPKGSGPSAPVVAEKAPGFFASMDPDLKMGVVALLSGVGGLIAKKLTEEPKPPPDPMSGFAAIMTALNGPKGNPEEIRKLELAAEEKREQRAAADRAEAERQAQARRDHELLLAKQEREARAAEAIAADERARQRKKDEDDRLVMMSKLGLTGEKKEDPQVLLLKQQIDFLRNAPKTPDTLEAYKQARELFKALGVSVGDEKGGSGVLPDLPPELLKQAMTEFAPLVNGIGAKLFGVPLPTPAPVVTPQGPAPVFNIPDPVASRNAINQEIAQREQAAYEEGVRRAQAEAAALAAQQPPQAIPGVPPAPQMDAPSEPPPATVWPPPEAVEPPVEVDPRVAYEQRLAAEEAEREAWRIANAAPQAPTPEAEEREAAPAEPATDAPAQPEAAAPEAMA